MTRRLTLLALQGSVTAALVWTIAKRLDWGGVRVLADRVTVQFLAGAFVALALGQLLLVLRWRLVLSSVRGGAPFLTLLRYHLIGLLFSNLLPGAVGGDGARVYYLGRNGNRGYVDAGVSVAVDRALGLVTLVALANSLALGLPLEVGIDPAVRSALATVFVATSGAVGALMVLPTAWMRTPSVSPRGRFAVWWTWAGDVGGRLRQAIRSPRVVAGGVLLTLGNALLTAAVYRWFLASAGGIELPLLPLLLVITAVAVFVNVPISLNGIGLREQLHIWMLGSLAVSDEAAIGVSLIVFLQFLLFSLIGLWVWLRLRSAPVSALATPV